MKKIIIDAGHGGQDYGYIGCKVVEKDITLKLALMLNTALKKRGFASVCTREDDTSLSLKERCEVANSTEADLFISFHCNESANNGAKGIETFVYENTGATGELAQAIQAQLANVTRLHNRGVKERPILTLLNGIYIPAVVIEMGFLSNHAEESLLMDDNFLQKSADAIPFIFLPRQPQN